METSTHIWSDGELIPWEEAKVHFLTHALQYGTGVFEGIRAYSTPEGTAVFRLTEHMERLRDSAKAYEIPLKWSVEQLVEATRELLRVTGLDNAYIRPLVFWGPGDIGLFPKGSEAQTMIAAFPLGAYHGDDAASKGISTMVSSWRRISHNSFVPTAKGSGGYLNSMLAKAEALRAGCDEAILLNDAGQVAEGSGMNLFVVEDGVVYTPPVSSGILKGITRDSVMTLLRREGVEVVEQDLARGSLYTADEVFLVGTAAEVSPVRSVDGRLVGDGSPGPITRKTVAIYRDAVTGKLDEFKHWLTYV
ncbi:MAG: branched-chain amino acid transaminase [Actinomycetes bacterium]|jgi:branched-chain amino acid aminotransferase|nr:MAG: branched chain amino acid aminotransferase [Actinomycetota bacterium]